MQGRLYHLPYSFPGLVISDTDVLATGTTNYPADVEKQWQALSGPKPLYEKWDTVHGELMAFEDPEERLAALDALEGYVPGEKGLYERVLVPAEVAGEALLAWTYRVEKVSGIYLPDGRWPG